MNFFVCCCLSKGSLEWLIFMLVMSLECCFIDFEYGLSMISWVFSYNVFEMLCVMKMIVVCVFFYMLMSSFCSLMCVVGFSVFNVLFISNMGGFMMSVCVIVMCCCMFFDILCGNLLSLEECSFMWSNLFLVVLFIFLWFV